jgi:outer membrane immunogenic protein
MKKLLGLALAGALSVAVLPAVAADYAVKAPPPPIWTWTGFYIGVQAGAGWGRTEWDRNPGPSGTWIGTGGTVGGTIGANWQAPGSPWVLGIEGDWSWSNISPGSSAFAGFASCTGAGIQCQTRADWIATIRGRIGHANGPLLFYLTGGAAFASLHSFTNPASVITGVTSTETGWAVGGGLEGMLGGGWSLKAEYIYVHFGNFGQIYVPTNITGDWWAAHILRAGVNYKF